MIVTMRTLTRAVVAATGSLCLAAVTAGVASAQAPEPTPQPPVTNCYPLQGLVLSPCTVPINVGPFGPFDFDFLPGGSVFPPPAPSPT